MQPSIYGIRFSKIGKIYHFDASSIPDLRVGEHVIVETTRGRQIGEVIQQFQTLPPPPPDGHWKPVERRASAADLVLRQSWQQKQIEAMINCRARAVELQLPIKVAAAEFSFDGTRLALLYSADEEEDNKGKEEKVDLKSLRKDMQRIYTDTQVEMRQIGPRDVAKMLGGMGACGLETRCCSKFLTEFSPISIKMAKEQGVSLTPTEITGMCGRLRCCLIYEYEQYVEARKELPKRNKRVVTPDGEGKVLDVYPMRNVIQVELDPKNPGDRPLWREFHRDLVEPWDELEALRRKSAAPCDKHEGGGCDCGKSKGAKAESETPPEVARPIASMIRASGMTPEAGAQPSKGKEAPARSEPQGNRPPQAARNAEKRNEASAPASSTAPTGRPPQPQKEGQGNNRPPRHPAQNRHAPHPPQKQEKPAGQGKSQQRPNPSQGAPQNRQPGPAGQPNRPGNRPNNRPAPGQRPQGKPKQRPNDEKPKPQE